VTTVGYGDLYPHTVAGRLVAMALMLVGIGFLGVLTATVASYFVKVDQQGRQQRDTSRAGSDRGRDRRLEESIRASEAMRSRTLPGGVVAAVLLGLGFASASAGTSPPPPAGATAQCRDGSYSYSQHHSGTCSHHVVLRVGWTAQAAVKWIRPVARAVPQAP